jgi:hypothetical protein
MIAKRTLPLHEDGAGCGQMQGERMFTRNVTRTRNPR